MRMKLRTKIILGILIVALSFGAVQIALGLGATNAPGAYVIYDGTDYYLIEMADLETSYLEYRFDPNSNAAKLFKFYIETLTIRIADGLTCYVSEVTEKFVNYAAIESMYVDMRDMDATYIWFNSLAATPAFPEITKVNRLGADCVVSGRVYVDIEGYIIPRSVYTLGTTAPADVDLNQTVEFTLTVTGNDIGAQGFNGLLLYEVTGGAYTLEYNDNGAWVTLTGGTMSPPGGFAVTPDWNHTAALRFTAHGAGTYGLTFRLQTEEDEVVSEITHSFFAYQAPAVGSIAVPGFARMRIGADTQNVDVNLYNPAENPCYFKISLLLDDGTVLYESGLIEPGKGLYEITLSRALAPGAYDAVVKYETFSLADMSVMNGVELNIKLIAE